MVVTGASGMLGSHIVEQLLKQQLHQQEHNHANAGRQLRIKEVRALDLKPFVRLSADAQNDNSGTRLVAIQGSILDEDVIRKALRGATFVIHACSVVDFGNIPAEVVDEVNVKGTSIIIDHCLRENVKGLVYTSTLDVVLPFGGILDAQEDAPYVDEMDGPAFDLKHCPYVRSKLSAERAVLRAAREKGLRSIVIRPPGIYGERSAYHIVSELSAYASAGKMNIFKIGRGDAVFQRCYAGNVAHAHVLALKRLSGSAYDEEKDGDNGVYFCVDDTPCVNFFDFVEPYAKAKGYVVPSVGIPFS